MKLNKIQLIGLFAYMALYPDKWRFGQKIFNGGVELYPNIFEQFRATKYDPFHNDTAVIGLFELILDNQAIGYWYSTDEFKMLVDGINIL